jgi:hypothetical protein
VADLNRAGNELDEPLAVERFAALAKLQYQRHYEVATLQKLPPPYRSPQPYFECEVAGEGVVRIEVASLRDENVVRFPGCALVCGRRVDRLAKFLEPTVISTDDPALRIIGKKAGKAYPRGSPIDLLCFSDGLLVSPLDQVLAAVASLDDKVKRSFDRAWLLWEARDFTVSGNQGLPPARMAGARGSL